MLDRTSPSELQAASGLSGLDDPLRCADQACERVESGLSGPAELVIAFVSAAHGDNAEKIAGRVRERLGSVDLIGAIGRGVACGALESESGPAVSLLAIRGADAEVFACEDADSLARCCTSASLLLADTASIPSSALVSAFERSPHTILCGCVGPGGGPRQPGGGGWLLHGQNRRARGAVGVRFGVGVSASTLVSQGCRPIGENVVITRASRNIVYEVSGRPAAQVLRGLLDAASPEVRKAAEQGVLVGRVVDEYLPRFGRGDYLIREVARVLDDQDALALNDLVRVGQTIRFHVRDRVTATEDLALLLDMQKLHGPPAAVCAFFGEGRGHRLFGRPNHDAAAISRAFSRLDPGPEMAKPGKPIDTDQGPLPMAGLFTAAELHKASGPPLLHTHSVCALVLRPSGAG